MSEIYMLLIWVFGAGVIGGVGTAVKNNERSWTSYLAVMLGGGITGAFAAGLALVYMPGVTPLLPITLSAFCGMSQEQARGLLFKRIEKLI